MSVPFNANAWKHSNNNTEPAVPDEKAMCSPRWKGHPVPLDTSIINVDLHSIQELGRAMQSNQPITPKLVGRESSNKNILTVWDFFEWGNEMMGPHLLLLNPITSTKRRSWVTLVAFLCGKISSTRWTLAETCAHPHRAQSTKPSTHSSLMWLFSTSEVMTITELCGKNVTFSITQEEVRFTDFGNAHQLGFECALRQF